MTPALSWLSPSPIPSHCGHLGIKPAARTPTLAHASLPLKLKKEEKKKECYNRHGCCLSSGPLLFSHAVAVLSTFRESCVPTSVLCLFKAIPSVLADRLSRELCLLPSPLALAVLTTYVPSWWKEPHFLFNLSAFWRKTSRDGTYYCW